jgi:hypothetical protein
VTRFEFDYDEDSIPWERWEQIVSNALGGKRGQAALAEIEAALVALPEQRLIEGHLVAGENVCTIGALVAHKKAKKDGVDIAVTIAEMAAKKPCMCGHLPDEHVDDRCVGSRWGGGDCYCTKFEQDTEDVLDTANAGQIAGLTWSVAWHMAYLNDEQMSGLSAEDRYTQMLSWVRRAQGKEEIAA